MSPLRYVIIGMMVSSSAVAGLFFLRYWTRTRDRLFAIFAAVFWILSLHWFSRAFIAITNESQPYFYLVRLAAFLLVIVAILDKNRRR